MTRAGRAELAAALRRALRPPFHEGRFWAVQAMVVVIAGTHLFMDVHMPAVTGAFPAGIPVALLIIPVSYAAVHYGLPGSAATGVWATLLWLPDLLLPHDQGHVGADLSNLVLVDLVAFFVGHRIQAEQLALARLRKYAATVVRAEEDQRRRLARELHDEPLQLFLHLARHLDSLREARDVPPTVGDGLAEARSEALGAASQLRDVVRDLRPPALDQLGLAAALSSLLAEVDGQESELSAELHVGGDLKRLPPEIELGIFRVVQEAVRNAVRHASAHHLDVNIDFGPRRISVSVSDDGIGFDADIPQQSRNGHFGLLGMSERVSLLGGRFDVRSAPGAGTVIRAAVPTGR